MLAKMRYSPLMPGKKLTMKAPRSRVTVRRSRGLAASEWGPFPTVSATFFIGAKKGKKPENNSGFCRTQPKVFRQKELDDRVRAIRYYALVGRGMPKDAAAKAFAASRVKQKGWYRGQPEESAAYTIFFDPSIPGEDTPESFRTSMRRLAEAASGALCQDEVILAFDSPSGREAEGLSPDAADREAAATRFGKRRRR